ncbi:hypothetical protein CFP56_043627 [Quercus suber]|uniref:Uncharacterized protein n=1 Tax=Quercus suber TaxID=58331 RepID=A0AAW0LIS6_QUESU
MANRILERPRIECFVNNQNEITIMYTQYAKKNGLTWKKRTWAIIGVSVAVMLLLVVSIVYWLIIRTKRDP